MIEIPLTQGKVALIDDDDLQLVRGYRWMAWTTPRHNTYYAYAHVRRDDGSRTSVLMHRLILCLNDHKIKADHRDGDGLNNRRANLRACTNGENMRNRGAQINNSSGFKGVSWDKKRGKWSAKIKVNRKQKHIGYFAEPEAAYKAYCRAAIELHGEFVNFG